MTSEEFQLTLRLQGIFTPKVSERRKEFYNGQSQARFAHYTSSETALKIIRTKRIWMRNTKCMSDYREVDHGFDLLSQFFQNADNKNRFVSAFDFYSPNIAQEALIRFDQWREDTLFNTYIASISEHDDKEDLHGRLSMWRAFGGNSARVAIVFNIPYLSVKSPALNVIFNPVSYHREDEVYAEINAVINNVQNSREFLSSVDCHKLRGQVFNMLVAGVTCLKHEGFREEREWRVLYAPRRWPSPFIEHAIQTIGGIPQIVYELPLDITVSDTLANYDIARVLDRIIIGPSQYPLVQYEAFVDALKGVGVSDAEKRVFVSGIPIRT